MKRYNEPYKYPVGVPSTRCHRCNHHLTRPESVSDGLGPICIHEVITDAAQQIMYQQALRAAGVEVKLQPIIKQAAFSSRKLWERNQKLIKGW